MSILDIMIASDEIQYLKYLKYLKCLNGRNAKWTTVPKRLEGFEVVSPAPAGFPSQGRRLTIPYRSGSIGKAFRCDD